MSEIKREYEYYFILLQSISKMLYSYGTDFLATEFQCGEYLYEKVKEVKWSKDRRINIVTELWCVPSNGKGTAHKVAFLFSFHSFYGFNNF